MICDECQKNEATFSITVTSGDEVTTRHLCVDCMKKMEISLNVGDIQSFLSSILSVMGSPQADDSPVCSGCGLHYSAFERTGKLGCAQCYRDFAEQLRPLLQRIHGCTQHVGHTPEGAVNAASGSFGEDSESPAADQPPMTSEGEKTEIQLQRELLRQKMDEAVACENFEDAAKYRDELRALTLEGGGEP